MIPVLPTIPETPVVSLIPELRVYAGQNQIRRNVGLFATNIQGAGVQTVTKVLQPNDTFQLNNVKAFVLSCNQSILVAMTWDVNSVVQSCIMNSKLLMWDQALSTLNVSNNASVVTQLTLVYVE